MQRYARREGKETRKRIVQFIHDYWTEKGYGPSYREIGRYIGQSTSVVKYHLDALQKEGAVTSHKNTARSIRVAGTTDAPSGVPAALAQKTLHIITEQMRLVGQLSRLADMDVLMLNPQATWQTAIDYFIPQVYITALPNGVTLPDERAETTWLVEALAQVNRRPARRFDLVVGDVAGAAECFAGVVEQAQTLLLPGGWLALVVPQRVLQAVQSKPLFLAQPPYQVWLNAKPLPSCDTLVLWREGWNGTTACYWFEW